MSARSSRWPGVRARLDGRTADLKTVMIAIIMDFAARVRDSVDRMRRIKTRRRAAQDLRRSLALIVDSGALESSFATRIKEFFDPDLLVIFQLDSATSDFRPTFSSGMAREELEDFSIDPEGKLARWFTVNETCLLVNRDRGVINYLEASEQELLKNLGARICAPLLARNHLAGILLLGASRDWRPSRRDAELLLQFANQASLAFQNATLYEEQRRRLDKLHRADRLAAVGQLAASVAHEVRNPLTAIRSTIQYLGQSFEDSAKRELVNELIDEVDRIDHTVSSLLSLTRARSFRPEAIDLVDLVKLTIRLVQPQAREQAVRIEEHFADPTTPLLADPAQLKQVFLNLLLNSLQAMPDGGLITVTTHGAAASSAAQDRPPVRIEIADDGPGIPQDKLGAVFDPFFTTKSGGTGLGLAICHGIVQRHDGQIEVESTEGEGTVIAVQLPLPTEADSLRPDSPKEDDG